MLYGKLPAARNLSIFTTALTVILPSAWASLVRAEDPVPGFVENWTGTTTHSWMGGAILDNPGSGGAVGAGDGYLRVSTPALGRLGTFSSEAQYTGNWRAAGITSIKVWLSDVGADQSLEIHFSIGRRDNLWQYNVGFSPPHGSWAEFTIDLTSAASFTRTHGVGTFDNALINVTHVHFRHDLAPYVSSPDVLQGEYGVDRFTLVTAPTPITPSTWGRLKALYR